MHWPNERWQMSVWRTLMFRAQPDAMSSRVIPRMLVAKLWLRRELKKGLTHDT